MAVLKKLNFKKNKKKILIIIIIVIVLIIAGCIAVNYQFITKDTSKKESNKTEVTELNTPKELQIVNSLSTSRPFAIMINNASDARKVQSGLQDAFIIYEIIVEGGITRYLALFMDQETARIGSIRSARHYFLDYALENDAIYVHHGQSPQAKNDFSNLGIDRIEVNEKTTGWRDKTLNVSYEHTLFTSIESATIVRSNVTSHAAKSIDCFVWRSTFGASTSRDFAGVSAYSALIEREVKSKVWDVVVHSEVNDLLHRVKIVDSSCIKLYINDITSSGKFRELSLFLQLIEYVDVIPNGDMDRVCNILVVSYILQLLTPTLL